MIIIKRKLIKEEHCPYCKKHCPLSNPHCSKGKELVKEKKKEKKKELKKEFRKEIDNELEKELINDDELAKNKKSKKENKLKGENKLKTSGKFTISDKLDKEKKSKKESKMKRESKSKNEKQSSKKDFDFKSKLINSDIQDLETLDDIKLMILFKNCYDRMPKLKEIKKSNTKTNENDVGNHISRFSVLEKNEKEYFENILKKLYEDWQR